MSRTTYVIRDGKPVPKACGAAAPAPRAFHVMGDIRAFRSPIDGSVIASRSQLREHERRHGVRQVGNDWTGSTRPSWWQGPAGRAGS
jgi:hypothetical protein